MRFHIQNHKNDKSKRNDSSIKLHINNYCQKDKKLGKLRGDSKLTYLFWFGLDSIIQKSYKIRN